MTAPLVRTPPPRRRSLIGLTARVALAAVLLGSLTAGCGGDGRSSSDRSSTSAAPSTTARRETAACRGSDATSRLDVAYGDRAPKQRLDIHRPTLPEGCGPAPIVVWVHGGGFRTGDKANNIGDKVDLFTREGWVVVGVNYRLSPQPPSDDPERIRYPTHEQDVAEAIAWAAEHAGELGGDPDRILLLGHSSGAFLVSLLSTDSSFLTDAGVRPDQVRCTVALDTEYDIPGAIALGGSLEALYRNAFGDDPATWERGSPRRNIGDGTDIPAFLIVTRGLPRRTEAAQAFADDLRAAAVEATVIVANPMTHGEVNAAVGQAGDTLITPAIMDFYRACTEGSGAP